MATVATSFETPNFSGALFQKGIAATPFSTMIGAAPLTTNNVKFVCGQYYDVETGSQPSISETASLTAPDASVITRSQLSNVTQIFHESVYVSYGKQSNMGTLSGLNIDQQIANPQDELLFQIERKMAKIAQDIEYTFLNGVYNEAASDSEVNQTRGLLTAIETNVVAAGGESLNYWIVAQALKAIHDQGAPTNEIVLGVDATTMLQLQYTSTQNNMTIVPESREVNGLKISTLITPLGVVGVQIMDTMPAGTAVLFNPSIMHPVFQPVPNKGNFFLEPLAKTGAGERYQIFGQAGLDHGPEWMSAKITGISTDLPGVTVSGE